MWPYSVQGLDPRNRNHIGVSVCNLYPERFGDKQGSMHKAGPAAGSSTCRPSKRVIARLECSPSIGGRACGRGEVLMNAPLVEDGDGDLALSGVLPNSVICAVFEHP